MLQTVYRTPSGLRFVFACPARQKAEVEILQKETDQIVTKAEFSPVPYGGNLQEAFVPFTDLGIGAKNKWESTSSCLQYVFRADDKVVIDPRAQLVLGRVPYADMSERSPLKIRAGFCEHQYDWGEDKSPLNIPYENVVAYYLHVRGFTMDAASHVRHRGTFLGLREKIPYLKDLGVNQVILMPAYEYEEVMEKKGKPRAGEEAKKLNYWGYTKSWYFAPKAGYSFGPRPDMEFRDMVKALHLAGIEIVMEFSFPDEVPADLALGALLWWAQEYHIDGFRLLARNEICKLAASCQQLAGTKLLSPYFDDPVTADEPDYKQPQVQAVYRNLADCNTGYRTDCRRILKGDEGMLQSFIGRVRHSRKQVACVNYLTDHDGFTLWDLVSYDRKHNEENGEQGTDGAATEYSWNCGVEGPSKKQSVQALRLRQAKNALAMLLLSRGTPMLLAGDEFGNSQGGNNNPYCIDSAVTWLNWSSRKKDKELHDFVKALIAFRKAHPVLCEADKGEGTFRNEKGYPFFSCHTNRAWYTNTEQQDRHVGMMYCSREDQKDTYLYVAYNFDWEEQEFALPYLPEGMNWKAVLSTDPACVDMPGPERSVLLPGRSITVLEGC